MLELPAHGPGAASYGFALAVFAAFALYLALAARRGARAALLLAAVAASGLWAALNLAHAIEPSPALWTAQFAADGLRMAAWLLFAGALIVGTRRLGWWSAALAVSIAAVFVLPRDGAIGLYLALAIAGLVLVEQVFRRVEPNSRWSVKPLCLGLGAAFVFDLYLYADALLFGRMDADLWAARGLAQALALPAIAVATARNRAWTLDIALSRGVVIEPGKDLFYGSNRPTQFFRLGFSSIPTDRIRPGIEILGKALRELF